MKYIKVLCEQCGKEFQREKGRYNEAVKRNWKQFCSHKCMTMDRTKAQEVLCKFCGKKFIKEFSFIKNNPNHFCSSSCAATFNNKNRIQSEETRQKISKSLSGQIWKRTPKRLEIIQNRKKYFKERPGFKIMCKICGKEFISKASPSSRRKTCSDLCKIKAMVLIRPYQNGSKRITPFFNPYENKKVLLDSSWELKTARLLCKFDIEWNRPEPLSWIDKNGKNHLYFPDFFLPQYNVYLDPKNPYCMDRDKEKMKYFENKINLIYGKLSVVTDYIEKIGREEGLRSLDPCAPNAVL